MKEQIEEMGKLCPFYEEGKCNLLEDEAAECNFDCDMCDFARTLYNAGFRKQSENVIELPCAIGTTIYELIYEKEDPCSWCEHDHSGFGDYICDLDYDHYPEVKDFINGEKICPEFQMNIIDRTFDLCFYYYDKDWFNITWFLTKEEAENALAKMKGGAE